MSKEQRAEATPKDPARLAGSQQDAVARFLRMLHEQLKEKHKDSADVVDSNRRNRMMFWTGEPGVGKTSAYVSVRSWFERTAATPSKWPFPVKMAKEGSDERLRLLMEEKPRLKRLNAAGEDFKDQVHRVRWLEPLDLELMSGHPNFLAAVLARIDESLSLKQGGAEAQPSWIHPGDSGRRDAEKEFRRLQNDIALSWEGNLRERGGALEPDVYAHEVMRAEQARLNVNMRFRKVVGELARCAPMCTKDQPALFVLPIDDFYLKPDVTLELLRFLRMISSQHLFILMMGDIDVVEDLVFWHSMGEAARLMQQGGARLLNDDGADRLRKRAMSLATATIHKLIPTNQRVPIDTMTPEETLEFPRGDERVAVPEGYGSDETARSIEELLSEEVNGKKNPLSFLSKATEDKFETGLFWFLRDALQITPRQAADLHRALREQREAALEANGEPNHKPAFAEALRRDEVKWGWCKIAGEQVERALYSDARGMRREVAEKIFDDMLDPAFFHRWKFPECVQVTEDEKSRRWNMSYKDVEDPNSNPVAVSPLTRAWLAVLHDVLTTPGAGLADTTPPNKTQGNRPFYEGGRPKTRADSRLQKKKVGTKPKRAGR